MMVLDMWSYSSPASSNMLARLENEVPGTILPPLKNLMGLFKIFLGGASEIRALYNHIGQLFLGGEIASAARGR